MTAGRARRDQGDGANAETGERPPDAGKAARLRPMVRSDLADVIALEHELFPEDPWTAEMFADEVAQPPEVRLYLVAEAEDGAVAARDPADGRGTEAGPVIAGYAGCCSSPAASRRTC